MWRRSERSAKNEHFTHCTNFVRVLYEGMLHSRLVPLSCNLPIRAYSQACCSVGYIRTLHLCRLSGKDARSERLKDLTENIVVALISEYSRVTYLLFLPCRCEVLKQEKLFPKPICWSFAPTTKAITFPPFVPEAKNHYTEGIRSFRNCNRDRNRGSYGWTGIGVTDFLT